jgi:hypothetical protein
MKDERFKGICALLHTDELVAAYKASQKPIIEEFYPSEPVVSADGE